MWLRCTSRLVTSRTALQVNDPVGTVVFIQISFEFSYLLIRPVYIVYCYTSYSL